MRRYGLLMAVGLLLVGCESTNQRDLQYRADKAESERDQLQARYDDERAKVAVLQERLAAEQKNVELARAETNLMRDRARQVEADKQELVGLLEQRTSEPLEEPEVSASPLAPEIDGQLRSFAARHRGRVWYDRGRAAISFANESLFDPGSDVVRPSAQGVLGELAGIAALTATNEVEIIVVGHTDDTPISSAATLAVHPSNWHLSVHRAIAVKSTLVSAGLPERRLGVMGYGAFRPLGNDKARNRRVEVFFAPWGEVSPRTPVRPARTQ